MLSVREPEKAVWAANYGMDEEAHMNPSLHERIRERAYHLWQQDGASHGDDWSYWIRAEQEILAEAAEAPAPVSAEPAKGNGSAAAAASEAATPAPATKPAAAKKASAKAVTSKSAAGKSAASKSTASKSATKPAAEKPAAKPATRAKKAASPGATASTPAGGEKKKS